MTDRLRVGVIGAGRWSRTAHLPGWYRSPLADLVTICDLDRDAAESAARTFEIPEVTTDWQALLARPDLDVVDIVTRGDHQDLVFATLEAGRHCLVEKTQAFLQTWMQTFPRSCWKPVSAANGFLKSWKTIPCHASADTQINVGWTFMSTGSGYQMVDMNVHPT